MESFKELFEMVKEYTRQYVIDSHELSEIAYQVWIKSLEPVSFDGNTAVLFIKAEFMKKIVEEKYLGLLNRAFEAVVGFPVQIEIRCETSGQSDRSEGTASVQTSSASPVLPSYSQEEIDMNSQGGEYEYTFSTFIVGSSNKFAQAACRAVAQNPANAYNPLFIYGGSGLGKTHLLYAIAAEIKENRPNTNVIYVKGEEFTIRERIRFNAPIQAPIFTYTIKDKKGTDLTGTNTLFEGTDVHPVKEGDIYDVAFTQKMTLQGGEYLLSMSCTGFEGGEHVVYHRLYDVANITVISNKNTVGVYDMEPDVAIRLSPAGEAAKQAESLSADEAAQEDLQA